MKKWQDIFCFPTREPLYFRLFVKVKRFNFLRIHIYRVLNFNLFFILGVSSVVRPVPVPDGGIWDLLVVTLLSVLLLFMCLTHRQQIIRREAVVLLGIYVFYIGERYL